VASEPPQPEAYRPPPYHLTTWLVLGAALVFVLGLISVRTDYQPNTSRDYPSRAQLPDAEPVLLPPPEMSDEYFPCADCHEGEPANPKVRVFEDEHVEMPFEHGTLWCYHCHGAGDPEKLHLADATFVAFDESWRLCTQCHARKLADWRAGEHGKRTGHWLGPKEYWNCVACHDAHSPRFEPLEPEPPPLRPTQVTLTGNAVEEVSHAEP
jgi:hypothetical protein